MSASPALPITALVYSDSAAADRLLREIAAALAARGFTLSGLVQHNNPRPGRSRCDMLLEDLATGECVGISEDRGLHARGCALDPGQLLAAMGRVERALETRPDLVILNKFGKTESEGGGFRPLIAAILEAGLPLVIAVPWRNIESWRRFAGEFAAEMPIDQLEGCESVLAALGLPVGPPRGQAEARSPRRTT